MRFLVFQHVSVEHPGIFSQFFAEDGITWDAIELDEGEAIPPFDDYDALWVMGGPMDVWDKEANPFLLDEISAIQSWVRQDKPFMGLCLGHQLLAEAMGGKVGLMESPEIGIFDIELTEAGIADSLFNGIAPISKCLQWHGAAILEAPPSSSVLARSSACEIQALRVGKFAYGLQYHVEISSQTVPEWAAVPEYGSALEGAMGYGAMDLLQSQTDRHLPAFAKTARTLYENFMSLISESAPSPPRC